MNKGKRRAAFRLASAILSAAVALMGAMGLQGRVIRTVDIVQLFGGGVGTGAVIAVEIAERRRRLRPVLFPAMKYQDGPAALAWLEKAFGFTRGMVMTGTAGAIAHAELTLGRGPAMLMIGSLGKPDPANPWPTAEHSLYAFIPDVDAHHARAKASGARIIKEPHDTAYGSREYSALDLEGRLWSFGTYNPEV